MKEILKVCDLTVKYPGFTLEPCSFSMEQGEILAVAGESGSGKTTLARALSRLLDEEAAVRGEVVMAGSSLYEMKEKDVRLVRMETFSIVFQNSGEWLNPAMKMKAFAGDAPCLTALLNGDGKEAAEELRPKLIAGIPHGTLVMEKAITASLAVHTGPGLVGIGALKL